MDKLNWLKIFPLAVLLSAWFCFFHAMILAWQSGSWQIMLDFNSVGEGYTELLVTTLSGGFIVWYVYQELKSWKN